MYTQYKHPLTIGFVGGLRYFEINKKIIKMFANSEEYRLLYVGRKHPGCDLEEYSVAIKVQNIEFLPVYKDEEKPRIYENIHIINSIYGSDTPEVRTALPNKLYDAVLYKKPILVSKGTYLQGVVEEYDLGLAVEVDGGNLKGELTRYLCELDKDKFVEGCERFLKIALKEKREMLEQVDGFIKKWKKQL